MDASASPRVDADINEVYGFFVKIENSSYSSPFKHKNTVIKYTKLPDFDFDSRVSWPEKSYTLQPRLRRIITLDDPEVITSRSLKPDLIAPLKTMSSVTRRKIVTIAEDDESDLHPKFSKDVKRCSKTSNKAVEAELKNEKQFSQRTTSRLTNSSKYSRETKPSAKSPNLINRKDVSAPKPNFKSKYSNLSQSSPDNTKVRSMKERDTIRTKSTIAASKVSLKNSITPSESEKELSVIKTKLYDSLKGNTQNKKSIERPRYSKTSTQSNKNSATTFLREIKSKNKPVTIIHVPLDENYQRDNIKDSESHQTLVLPVIDLNNKKDFGTFVENEIYSKDVNIGTDPRPITFDKVTQSDACETLSKSLENANVQTDLLREAFDSLDIPNVTLTKDKNESKEESVKFNSKSLPNLKIPSLDSSLQSNECSNDESKFFNSTSYIIGHATVTCTTKQKINFHVVGSSNETSNQSPSPLSYPVNVVSIYEKEIKKKQLRDSFEQEDKSNAKCTNCLNELKSLNCSYVFNSNKLVKPSDIISTIRVNNDLLQSDYICEQFERELNFIDSFFESLQYLESCSLADKCFTENKVKSWVNNTDFDVKNSEYGCFLSKLENGAIVDDTETMASKSLCLLNLLIRDEQRRAKNLLFVLKMREDALKDFTKSQILWLENKKKQENTDISTLKKKQRGALLKLQHECGEMQRMRKALLTQSEKRKVVLLKTKKNIELKLKNSVDVEQILLSKKKLKRNSFDRNTAPLKCFDLSSSGCEESSTSRPKSAIPLMEVPPTVAAVRSAEKCIQTGESEIESLKVDQATDTAAENFVVVDGGYLNILFHNLSMPQIFSSGKQYEVNEEALRNIVNSVNSNQNMNEGDVLDRFMNQIKNPDLETSTPSTARSLVEEMDQYYKGLIEEEKSPVESHVRESVIYEVKDSLVQAVDPVQFESRSFQSASTMTSDSADTVVLDNVDDLNRECVCDTSVETEALKEPSSPVGQGPLPVPAGSAEPGPEPQTTLWAIPKSSNTNSDCSSISSPSPSQSGTSLSSMTSPLNEAEELRRQQLAIEREIKALEQQQCQLLVVREIPDKPPPPYTPPAEARVSKLPRMYVADETTEEKIQRYIKDPHTGDHDPTDAFDSFVRDFCLETIERQTQEKSDKPWDSCNLLPQKPPEDTEKVIKKTSSHLLEILTGVAPTIVSGVGARRSDHIDDILFAEWRRCEPEWTALHTDEALVKNQIFECIFQKILTETVDEYKRTVLLNK
ncbi:uncharacterized protein LOC114365047 [Ostrinia furnacalis]|uniref:uncharacterized protein LOC114365047 n=1 Tax=Ostrinia furnacalis TaxID=93504 RepID=UPI001038F760|nr:uncharacterized protein LOC114365047 [Ostrinia furnacalis]